MVRVFVVRGFRGSGFPRFRVSRTGLGFGVSRTSFSSFEVSGSGFPVRGFVFGVSEVRGFPYGVSRFGVSCTGFPGAGCRVQGFGRCWSFRGSEVLGFGFGVFDVRGFPYGVLRFGVSRPGFRGLGFPGFRVRCY